MRKFSYQGLFCALGHTCALSIIGRMSWRAPLTPPIRLSSHQMKIHQRKSHSAHLYYRPPLWIHVCLQARLTY